MVTELKPKTGLLRFRRQVHRRLTEHVCPAEIPDEITAACKDIALRAHRLLGCRGTSRSDFRWDDEPGRRGAVPARDQHPAGHDPAQPGARTGAALWAWNTPIWSRRSSPRRWPMRRAQEAAGMAQTIRRKAPSARARPPRRRAPSAQGRARPRRTTGSALDRRDGAGCRSARSSCTGVFLAVILGGAAALAWVVASFAGLPAMAGQQLAARRRRRRVRGAPGRSARGRADERAQGLRARAGRARPGDAAGRSRTRCASELLRAVVGRGCARLAPAARYAGGRHRRARAARGAAASRTGWC